MTDKEFRHLLARMIQSAAAADQLAIEKGQLTTRLKRAEEQIMRLKPGRIEERKNGRSIDMVFRIDETTIGYRVNPKAFIEEAAETCKRELFQKLKIV